MDPSLILKRYLGLLFNTKKEWQRIEMDQSNFTWHFSTFVLPCVGLLLLLVFGVHFYQSGLRVAIAQAIVQPSIILVVIFLGANVMEKMSGKFTPGNKRQFKLILNYASIPIFVTQALILATGYFGIFALLSLVIVWFGIEQIINPIHEKKVGFFLLSSMLLLLTQVVSTIVFYSILGLNY